MASLSQTTCNVVPLPPAVTISVTLDIPVFPCRPDKRPFTKNGFKDATDDPHQIIKLWEKHHDASTAMPTGKPSGYCILDVDDKNGHDGSGSLHELENQHGKIPETWITLTPSGGFHYWFKNPATEVRNSQSKIGDGLDIRGNGGYVIIPPSAGYEFEASNPDECADMPDWLITLVNKKKEKSAIKKHRPIQQSSNKTATLVQRINRKKGYITQLPSISNIKLPDGKYPAKFIGWQAMQRGKFILKKGQVRLLLRFAVNAGGFDYQLNAYRTINVLHNGCMSIGASNKLASDISAVAGNHENGWPVQVNLNDIDVSIFCDRDLLVTTHCTKKKRIAENNTWKFKEAELPYAHISTISIPLPP